MQQVINLLVDNISFILIASGAIAGIYYVVKGNSNFDIGKVFMDKDKYQKILEVTLGAACAVEAIIASRIAAEEELADARFMLHIILVFLSVVIGFRIAKEVTESFTTGFALIKALLKVKLGAIVYCLFAFALQTIQAILALVATVAGPFANWILIAQSQGDANVSIDINKIHDFMDVIQFNYISIQFTGSAHDWTVSSFAVLFIHIIVILILTTTSADEQVLGGLKDLFKNESKKEIPTVRELTKSERDHLKRNGTSPLPQSFEDVKYYVNANTKIGFTDIQKLVEIDSIKFIVKQSLTRLTQLAIYAREMGDADAHIKYHSDIESFVEKMLKKHCHTIPLKDRAEETKEKIKREAEEKKKKAKEEAKKKNEEDKEENKDEKSSVSDRPSSIENRPRDHSEDDDKEEESGDD